MGVGDGGGDGGRAGAGGNGGGRCRYYGGGDGGGGRGLLDDDLDNALDIGDFSSLSDTSAGVNVADCSASANTPSICEDSPRTIGSANRSSNINNNRWVKCLYMWYCL